LEAWAAGLPVLATRVGALSEFEKHGEAIHLVDTCSVESLKVGLTWARSHWKDHKAMADACQDVIKSNYDWDQVGRRYLEVYGSLS
jgi:glycosyltransferase involved in cell wall biosynthesis